MFRTIALVIIVLALFIVSAAAQEIPAVGTEIVDRSGADLKEGPGQSELINSGTYAFSVQSGIALADMSSGTTQIAGSNSENVSSTLQPLGFLFRFDGVDFTTFGVSSNGLISLGGVVSTSSTLNALNSVANAPKLALFWDHLCVGSTGKVHYKTTGIFGARRLVVEWKNVEINRPGGGCIGTGNSTFQLWISEYNGVVQFVYGSNMVAATTSGGYSVGIQSGAATNFASVTTATNTVDYSTANNTQTSAINLGTSYLFSPNLPATPSGGSVTNIRQTSMQLNWTDNASNEGGYYIWRTTDTVNFTLVAKLPPNTTSFTDTGLTPATQYRHYITAVGSEGGYSGFLFMDTTTNPTGNISSTAAGGLWSAPSTWVGGLVPDGGDNVTIVSGATVIIDTAALAGNVNVGSVGGLAESKDASIEGGSPAVLRFGETAAFSLTVAHDVTIGSNDTFSTGGGNANQHVLTISGNLTNNGTFDLSTNNNQAAASLVFNGGNSSTFGGTGPVTDIFVMTVDKGGSNANVLEMTMSNFSVQGSTTETASSAFLFLNSGTLKISGTFSGAHRTFFGAAYQINSASGLWLNNPNYTIVAQNSPVNMLGVLHISAGTYNTGTATGDYFWLYPNASFIMDGGNMNTSGKFRIADLGSTFPFTYNQTGGTLTTCMVGRNSLPNQSCFDLGEGGGGSLTASVVMAGGDIVIQNPATDPDGNVEYRNFAGPAGVATITGTTLHFGSAQSSGTGFYEAAGKMPNVAIDTGQTVRFAVVDGPVSTRNINIGAAATLRFEAVTMWGNTFINNGILQSNSGGGAALTIDDGTGLADVTYSGVGTMSGFLRNLVIRSHSLTFDPAVGNIRTINIKLTGTRLVNAARVTLGNNDSELSTVELYDGASFESAPDFNIGIGGERVVYSGTSTTGPEIKPDRTLWDLSYDGNGSVTITGGDLTITNFLRMTNGRVITGANKLILFNIGISISRIGGYVEGTMIRRVNAVTSYPFPVGLNGYSPVILEVSALAVNPSFLTVTTVDETLPGLLPATSVSRYWKLDTIGSITGRLVFSYTNPDRRGNEVLYKLWRSNGGTPVMVPGSFPGNNMMFSPTTTPVVSGDWGVGAQLDPGPVSVSGRVTTSSGNPIRNATVTISGGGLPAPITVFTGSLGTYSFNGLQAGETYTITASAKRFRFPPGGQVVTPMSNVANVDFAANPQDEF